MKAILMNPIVKIIIAVIWLAVFSWWAVSTFLKESERYTRSMDVRTLSYLRDDGTSKATNLSINKVRENQQLLKNDDAGERTVSGELLIATRNRAQYPVSEDQQFSQASAESSSRNTNSSDHSASATLAAVRPTGDNQENTENPRVVARELVSENDTTGDSREAAETAASAKQRKILETMGVVRQPRASVRAVDVRLVLSQECNASIFERTPVVVQYRYDSSIIKGKSLRQLEKLVSAYRDCQNGAFYFAENPLAELDASPELMQLRFDELKYFFIQNSVPKAVLIFPDV